MSNFNRVWGRAVGAVAIAVVLFFIAYRATRHPYSSSGVDAKAENPLIEPRPAVALLALQSTTAGVSGTIRATNGEPIGNAQVCAFPDDRGLIELASHCVRSSVDGSYTIEGLPAVATQIHASAPTFRPGLWGRNIRGVTHVAVPLHVDETTSGLDITLRPGGVLVSGVVRDIAGGEIEGARLQISAGRWGIGSQGAAIAISGEDGRFQQWVAPGPLVIGARADGYAAGWVAGTAPSERLEVWMTPESILVGRVILASTGEAASGLEVAIDAMGGTRSTVSGIDGRFQINGLEPGVYKPTAFAEGLYGETPKQVHLGLAQTTEEILLPVYPAVGVEGQVRVVGGLAADETCRAGGVALKTKTITVRAAIDATGRVAFPWVERGTYEVDVECAGYLADADYPDLVVGDESVVGVVWEVHEGLAISGDVVDEAGRPVPGVTVSSREVVDPDAVRSRTATAETQSQSDGTFDIAGLLPGRYELSLAGEMGRPAPTDPVSVELVLGADVKGIRLVMPPSGTVHGRVTNENHEPVAGASILATWGETAEPVPRHSDEQGEFVLDGLWPGPLRVGASTEAFELRAPGATDETESEALVDVVANEVVEVTLTVETSDGRISGVVRDDGGSPVTDAFVSVEHVSGKTDADRTLARRKSRWSWGHAPTLTDSEGRFERVGLPDGKFVIRATRKGGGEAILEDVALGEHVELTIVPPGELSGSLRGSDGTAPERFTVTVKDKRQGIELSDSFFHTDGVWRLSGVPTGRYEVAAKALTGQVTLDQPVELGDGEVRERIELILTGTVQVRGRIVDLDSGEPVAGMSVSVTGATRFLLVAPDDGRANITASNGRFEVEGAAVGLGDLSIHPLMPGQDSLYSSTLRTIVVTEEPPIQDIGDIEVVRLRLGPNQTAGDLGFTVERDSSDPDAEFVVASVGAGGPAEAAGLVLGDHIVKVDGHDVRGKNGGRYYGLTRVPEGTRLSLTLAEGSTVEVVAAAHR